MSCYTLYVVREGPGEPLIRIEKYGSYRAVTPADLPALIADLRAAGRAYACDPSGLYGALGCQGLYADLPAKAMRFYHCELPPAPTVRLLAAEVARRRADPAWAGWDVAYAWDRKRDFLRLLGQPEPDYSPPELEAVLAGACGREEGWWTSWDPAARVLTYRAWGPLSLDMDAWVTVIAADGRMHDVALKGWETVPALLAHGPAVIDALLAEVPCPPLEESFLPSGAVIDARARRIVAWTRHPLPAQVAAAWPGWRFERGEGGLPWHLAYTGRNAMLYVQPRPEPPPPEARRPWDAAQLDLWNWLAPLPEPQQPPPGEGAMYLETDAASVRPGRVFGDPVPGEDYWRRPGAYALIRDERGLLAVVEVEGREWHLPGGGIDRGEAPDAALVREVREETGLAVQVLGLVAEIDEHSYSRKERYFVKAGLYYEARVIGQVGGQVEPDHRLIWAPVEEAAARLLCEGQRWLLREAWPRRE